jgi:hypothetical protein
MAAAEQHHDVTPAQVDQAEHRYQGMLRMIGHVKDALRFPLDRRELVRAIALAGYNANPEFAHREAGEKAQWAAEDADALLAVGSDEEPS